MACRAGEGRMEGRGGGALTVGRSRGRDTLCEEEKGDDDEEG